MGCFFGRVAAPADIRRIVVALAARTGWSMAELLALTVEELVEWLQAARDIEAGI